MTAACIGEPISWLRLETYALDGRDPAIREHLEACPACARCLEDIRGSAIELPRLVIPARPERRWRWRWILAPAMAAVAAALVLLVVIRRPDPEVREDVAHVKGVGDVVIGVVRERAGTIRDDVLTYAPGDRWKVVVTCPPTASAWIDVAVIDGPTIDRLNAIDYPLTPVRVSCGNRIALPGAFSITGDRPNRVCVRVAATAPPVRTAFVPGDPDVACLTLVPE